MSNDDLFTFLVFAGLCDWCGLYACVLNRQKVHDWYHPEWEWLVVVVGVVWVLGALFLLTHVGLFPWRSYWLVWIAFIAGGAPIIIWQLGLYNQNLTRQREARKKETTNHRREHGTTAD